MTAGSEQRGRLWVAVVAAVVGLATTMTAVQAAPAAADVPDHEIVTVISDISSNPTRAAVATCPFGKDLIGMGGNANSSSSVLLESMVPDLNTESVTVSAREGRVRTSNDWLVKATAVCADQGSVPGRYLIEDETTSDPGQTSAAAIAACDPGDWTLGVGFELSGAPGRLHLTTLLPTDHAVIAAAEEDNAGTPVLWDVKVIGLCAALFDSQVHVDENTGLTASRPHTTTAACPTDFQVTGGGGFVDDLSNSTGYVTLKSFNPGEIEGTGYFIGYLTAGSGEPPPGTTSNSRLTTYVICADLR